MRPPFKVCSMCAEAKSMHDFHTNPASRWGMRANCIDCGKAYHASYREKNREKIRTGQAAYREDRREDAKQRTADWRAAHPGYDKEYRSANHERILRNWITKGHRRRARIAEADGDHSAKDVVAQMARQKSRCFYCGMNLRDEYHVEHVVPLCLGGSNGPENIVVACPSCNLAKATKHPMDFAGIMF